MNIQRKVKRKDRLSKPWLFIYIAVISCVIITSFSAARYQSEQTDSMAWLELGKPIINITDISQDELNNTKRDIEFNIQNYEIDSNEAGGISDVTLLYNLQIVNNNNIDFTYTLYKGLKEESNKIITVDNKTPDYVLTHTEKQTDKYILELNFNTAPSLKDVISALTINVNAIQQI